jgi:hypothetical protein
MDAETAEIFDAIYQLFDQYEKWEAPLRQYFADHLVRVNRDGFTWEQFERGHRDLEAKLKMEQDPQPDLFRLSERMCSHFVGCDSTTRDEIRARVAEREGLGVLFRNYADCLATQIKNVGEIGKLQLALAAVLIENCNSDYRDTMTTLADLYVRAEEVGMAPKRLFESASKLATDSSTPGGCGSLARMLREFESYAVVGERRRMGRPYRDRAL